jgi:hypothetical protein
MGSLCTFATDSENLRPVGLAMLPTPPTKIFGQKNSKKYIYLQKILVHYRHFFGHSEENSTIFLVTTIFKEPFLSSTQSKESRSGRIQNVWVGSGFLGLTLTFLVGSGPDPKHCFCGRNLDHGNTAPGDGLK